MPFEMQHAPLQNRNIVARAPINDPDKTWDDVVHKYAKEALACLLARILHRAEQSQLTVGRLQPFEDLIGQSAPGFVRAFPLERHLPSLSRIQGERPHTGIALYKPAEPIIHI